MNKCFLLLFVILLSGSCKSSIQTNKPGMEQLSKELISKYGAETYYTDIVLSIDNESKLAVLITETKNPNSLTQEQWLRYSGGEWEKQADVRFTVEGAEAKTFMFQLNKEVSLSMLGDLLEKSKHQLEQEKQIKEPKFVSASVNAKHQTNSNEDGIFYYITLMDSNTQQVFNFVYDLKGNLVNTL